MSKKALIEAQDTVTAVQNAMLRVANLPKSGNVRGVSGCGRLALDKGIWTFAPGPVPYPSKGWDGGETRDLLPRRNGGPLNKKKHAREEGSLGRNWKKSFEVQSWLTLHPTKVWVVPPTA